MASKQLMDKLNDAIAREIQVSVQYMWQHVMVKGLHAPSVGGIFKKFAITEMKHAEEIAERLGLYEAETVPVIEWFGGHGELLTIDGLGTEEQVFERVRAALDGLGGGSQVVTGGPAE